MLKEDNSIIITLVPKKDVPLTISDFRLIFYCNVVRKCISKILANRIKDSLKDVIDQN